MIDFNIRQLAIDAGVDATSAYDKESFILSAIKNAGLAPVSISDESITVNGNLVTGYEVTLHFGDGSTCDVTYTASNLGDSYQYHRVTVGGPSPFMVEKRERKDFVRGGPMSPTPTPTGLPPTPTPTPAALPSNEYLAVAHVGFDEELKTKKMNLLTGFDGAYGVKSVEVPVGLQVDGFNWKPVTIGDKSFFRMHVTGDQMQPHLVAYDVSLTDGLVDPRNLAMTGQSQPAVGIFDNKIAIFATKVVESELSRIINLYTDNGSAVSTAMTEYVFPDGTLAPAGIAVAGGDNSVTVGELDGHLVILAEHFSTHDMYFKSYTVAAGLTEEHTFALDSGYSPQRMYFIDGRIVTMTQTTINVYSYDATTGFAFEFSLDAADFPENTGIQLDSIDYAASPATIHGSMNGGNNGFVAHINFNTESLVMDYTAPIDWETGEPFFATTQNNFVVGDAYFNNWENTRARFYYFTGTHFQEAWTDSEEYDPHYRFVVIKEVPEA